MDGLGFEIVRMYAYDRSSDVFTKEGAVGSYASAKEAIFWLGSRIKSFGLQVDGFDDDAGRAVFGVRASGELGDEYWYVKGVRP